MRRTSAKAPPSAERQDGRDEVEDADALVIGREHPRLHRVRDVAGTSGRRRRRPRGRGAVRRRRRSSASPRWAGVGGRLARAERLRRAGSATLGAIGRVLQRRDELDERRDLGLLEHAAVRRHHGLEAGDDVVARVHHRARQVGVVGDDGAPVVELDASSRRGPPTSGRCAAGRRSCGSAGSRAAAATSRPSAREIVGSRPGVDGLEPAA